MIETNRMSKGIMGWLAGALVAILLLSFGFWWWRGYMGEAVGSAYGVPSPEPITLPAASAVPITVSPSSDRSVLATVNALPDAQQFQSLLASTNVESQLTGGGPYTVFVPPDGAFSYLPANALSNMTAAEKKRLVQYHVIVGRALDINEVSSGSIQTLSKDPLTFTVDVNTKTIQVGPGWALQQIKARNGVVYIVSALLLPPSKMP